jgi:hypothetical protein
MSDLTDPLEQRKLLEAIYSIERAISSLAGTASLSMNNARQAASEIDSTIGKLKDRGKSAMDTLMESSDELLDLQVDNMAAAYNEYDAMLRKMVRGAKDIERSVDNSIVGNLFFGSGGSNAITGKFGGVGRAFNALQTQLFNDLPAGGLIGMLMLGFDKDQTWRAEGEKALQSVERLGASTRAEAAKLGEVMRNTSTYGNMIRATADDYSAALSAFAESGIDGMRALQTEVHNTMAGPNGIGSVLSATINLDKQWGLATGTMAKAVGALTAQGTDLSEAVNVVDRFGQRARAAGADVQSFVSNLTQMSSSLRLQRIDMDGAAKSFDVFRNLATGAGLDKAGANQVGMDLMNKLGSSINGMQTDLKAYIGNRILSQLTGIDPENNNLGLKGLYGMNTGFRDQANGRPVDMTTKVLEQLLTLGGMDKLPKEDRMYGYMNKIPNVTGPEAALLANLQLNSRGQLDMTNMDPDEKSSYDAVAQRLMAQQKPIEKLLAESQDLIARIGAALLVTLTKGFDAMVTVLLNPARVADTDFQSAIFGKLKPVGAAWADVGESAANVLTGSGANLFKSLDLGDFGQAPPGQLERMQSSAAAQRAVGEQRIRSAVSDAGSQLVDIAGSVYRVVFKAELQAPDGIVEPRDPE